MDTTAYELRNISHKVHQEALQDHLEYILSSLIIVASTGAYEADVVLDAGGSASYAGPIIQNLKSRGFEVHCQSDVDPGYNPRCFNLEITISWALK